MSSSQWDRNKILHQKITLSFFYSHTLLQYDQSRTTGKAHWTLAHSFQRTKTFLIFSSSFIKKDVNVIKIWHEHFIFRIIFYVEFADYLTHVFLRLCIIISYFFSIVFYSANSSFIHFYTNTNCVHNEIYFLIFICGFNNTNHCTQRILFYILYKKHGNGLGPKLLMIRPWNATLYY